MTSFRIGQAGAALLLASCVAVGCASPTAPSAPPAERPSTTLQPATVTLTVRVLPRSVETPLEGATVKRDAEVGHADAGGVCQFTLRAGDTANIGVSAPGFLPLGASAVLMNDQRWTFYLEPTDTATN